jgi:hypothetical protein
VALKLELNEKQHTLPARFHHSYSCGFTRIYSYIGLYEILPMKIPNIKMIQLLRRNKEELFEYLREFDTSLRSTDTIEVLDFEYGIKVLYYHNEGSKPYRNRVYINKMEVTLLR